MLTPSENKTKKESNSHQTKPSEKKSDRFKMFPPPTQTPAERRIGLRDIASPKMITTPIPDTELIRVNIDEIEDAPPSWNFFATQSQDNIINLAVSLLNEGQLSPIIIRARQYDDQMKKWECLAGHTRRLAAKYLVEEGHIDWQYLYAFAYPADKCTDIQARRIIVHSNTEQRHSMTPEEKQACFYFQYVDEMNKDRNQSAIQLTRSLMNRYGIKQSHAYNLRSIGTKLIPEFLEQLQNGFISIRNAIQLSRIDKNIQKHLFDEYLDKLNNINFKGFVGKTREQIDKMFNEPTKDSGISSRLNILNESDKDITFSVRIKKEAEDSFRKAMHRIYTKYGFPTKE